MKVAKVLIIISFICLIPGFVFPPLLIIAFLFDVTALLIIIIRRIVMPKEELDRIKAENEAKAAEARAVYAESKAQREKEKQFLLEQKRRDTTPVAAVLISVQSEYGKKVVGTAARGLIGAALGGTFGAAVGIATGRAKGNAKTATFSVKYESGRKGLETVNVNTPRFKELATLLVD